MCASYAIWGGGSGELEDDFFLVGVGSPNGKGLIFLEGAGSDSTM